VALEQTLDRLTQRIVITARIAHEVLTVLNRQRASHQEDVLDLRVTLGRHAGA
jgi:hypothetical protein